MRRLLLGRPDNRQTRGRPLTRPSLVLLALAITAGLIGCGPPGFRAHGEVASAGPDDRDNWRSPPQGCSRDPFDSLPPDKSKSILTFVWEDPGMRDPKVDNTWAAPDAPMRLEFSRSDAPPGVSATLHTRYKAGIPLDRRVCSTFHLETHEQPAKPPATRPLLAGELALDCRADGNHITANVRFEHCKY